MEFFASYTGADFLAFYAVMLATCVFAGLWIPANLRPVGQTGRVKELEDLSVLSGGNDRHATALLTNLFARGGVQSEDKVRVRVVQKDLDVSEAERTILKEIGTLKLAHIRNSLKPYARTVEERLINGGLLMDQGQRLQLRVLSLLPYIVIIAIGVYRQQAGAALGEPTNFLVGFLLLTFGLGIIRFVRSNPRTLAGNEALHAAQTEAARIRTAPTAPEAGFAVALFGTAVLVGTPWEPVHAMRGGWDGSNAGDGVDGGGCGGGGCGGCGG